MKIQENIGKISWSFADKVTLLSYGFVQLYQVAALGPSEFLLFAMLINIHTWLFIVCDGVALQNIIQFGMNKENRAKVNFWSLIALVVISGGAAIFFMIFNEALAAIYNEPRLLDVASMLPLLIVLNIPRMYSIKIIHREQQFNYLFLVNIAMFGTLTLLTVYLINTQDTFTLNDMYFMYIIALSASSITGILITFKHLKFSLKGSVKLKTMLQFSIPNSLSVSMHSMPKYLDVYVLKLFFGSEILGIYQAAKTLFRTFDEATYAANGLVYPTAVRQFEKKNIPALKDLYTKSISFMLMTFAVLIIVLELGLSDFIINTFLTKRYILSIDYFNMLVLTGFVLPFTLLSPVMLAYGKPKIVLLFVIISTVFSMTVFYLTGYLGWEKWLPAGIFIYYFIFGALNFVYIKRHFGFEFALLFRAIRDTKNFLNSFMQKRKLRN